MADYVHSSNYHKIVKKLEETNSIKDVEILRTKLESLEQDDEVVELLKKCDERIDQIKSLITEEKYQKALLQLEKSGSDIDSLISQFQEISGYKDSDKYLDSLKNEKEYRRLVNLFESNDCNWEEVYAAFKDLGDYKDSKKYSDKCFPLVEKQRKEKEIQERKKKDAENEAKYKEAISLMEKEQWTAACDIFNHLENYKDSKERKDECNNKLFDQAKEEKKKKKITLTIILSSIIIAIAVYFVLCLTKWSVDGSGHCHLVAGFVVGYSEHEFVFLEEELPTCELDGKKEYICSKCGFVKQEYVSPLGHSLDEGIITVEPTCTATGIKTYTCKSCGKILTELINPVAHSFENTITLEPLCEQRGIETSVCSICGYTITNTIPAKGHDWVLSYHVSPTCKEEGIDTYTCSLCGNEYSEVIPPNGHSWVHTETKEASCVAYGTETYICSSCDEESIKYFAPTRHSYLDGRCLKCGFNRNVYTVGMIGPAGGLICYDCDADNDSGNNDKLKSSECGWRFLEASVNILKVINGVPTINPDEEGYSDAVSDFVFGYYRKNPSEDNSKNLFVNGKQSEDKNYHTEGGIGKGKMNTLLLYSAMGDAAFSSSSGIDVTSNYAARLCLLLLSSNSNISYGDWFLPTNSEFYTLVNEEKLDKGDYWTSEEYYGDSSSFTWRSLTGVEATEFFIGDSNRMFGSYGSRSDCYKVIPFRFF